MKVNWPTGQSIERLLKNLLRHHRDTLEGRVVSIDPSSKSAGYAIFEAGKLVDSGIIAIPGSLPINQRLHQIWKELPKDPQPDVIVIEDVANGKMAHVFLKYAVGAIMVGFPTPILVMCPIVLWKALAKAKGVTHKADDLDAELIGEAIILFTKEHIA